MGAAEFNLIAHVRRHLAEDTSAVMCFLRHVESDRWCWVEHGEHESVSTPFLASLSPTGLVLV